MEGARLLGPVMRGCQFYISATSSGIHQVVLPKVISDHVLVLFHVGDVSMVKMLFRFENVCLEAELDFQTL